MIPRALLLTLSVASLFPLQTEAQSPAKVKAEEEEAGSLSKESLERKARSIARLKREGVPLIESLPVIEDSKETKLRSKEEIAERAIAVCVAAVKGEGADPETIDFLVKKYGAGKFFSPEEAAFIKNPKPPQQDRINATWRYECLWVLLWSLGYVDELDRPEKICDVKKAVKVIADRDTKKLIKDAKLRPIGEVLDEADLIYRYHWAVTDARVKGKPAPAKLEKGVVKERHYVLNWLIGYSDAKWDEVPTDT